MSPLSSRRLTPFTIAISDAELADLRARLKATRFAPTFVTADWGDGTNTEVLRHLVSHWAQCYDWRAAEQRLNSFRHFIEEIDGERVHFVYARGEGKHRTALVLANGWPSNFVELLPLVALLTTEHNGTSFDVVIPSLQGFGFSGRPEKPGMNMTRMAHLWAKLMTRLGYAKFLMSSSDLGTGICMSLVRNHPHRLLGAHYVNVFSGYPRPQDPTPEEAAYFQRVDLHAMTEGAYVMLHATKPQTLAAALNDSPAGLASWIIEKIHGGSHLRDGRIDSVYSLDDLCTFLSVYWFTQTIGSSIRLYKEAFADPELMTPMPRHNVKHGVLVPADIDTPAPRAWGERHLQNLVHWTEARKAGHFPALEAPEHYAADIRAFYEVVR
jgi:pimeloyl-ACP methyl ester carboxylesterase